MPKQSSSHRVILCKYTKPEGRDHPGIGAGPPTGGGGQRKLWAFSYEDLASLLGKSTRTVKRMVGRKEFDPTDLESIVRLYNERKEDAYRLGLRWLNKP